MLNLASESPPGWAAAATVELEALLIDHAHCEKKAASTAISLVFRYPQFPQLALPLSRLAREELAHFEQVVTVLRGRGWELERQHPSRYAGRLLKAVHSREPQRMTDTLLCCALIEARSCERMQCLAEHFESRAGEDPELAKLYRGLLASEARHHTSYVDLAIACTSQSPEAVRARLRELAAHEASVSLNEGDEPIRLHN